jgi:hypothetical protein
VKRLVMAVEQRRAAEELPVVMLLLPRHRPPDSTPQVGWPTGRGCC